MTETLETPNTTVSNSQGSSEVGRLAGSRLLKIGE